MSGGSFDYLYGDDHPGTKPEMETMLDVVGRELGFDDAADALRALVPTEPSAELRELMRCIEWWKSNDYSLGQVVEAYIKWKESK